MKKIKSKQKKKLSKNKQKVQEMTKELNDESI